MAKVNMYCKPQKASSKEFRDNFDKIFRGNQDVPYPEETREREIERRLKEFEK